MPGEVAAKRIRARAVAIVHDEKRDAEVHQGKGNSVSGASGADQHHGCTLRAGGSEAFLETVTPPTPVEIVTGGTAIRRNGDGVDRANLGGLGIHRIQQRQNVLLEGIGDVGARETGSFDRIEKLREPPPGQVIDVQQVVEAIDPRGRECVGKQHRRQRTHDIRANQSGAASCACSYLRLSHAATEEELCDARISKNIRRSVLDTRLALLQHETVVRNLQCLFCVLLDQQNCDTVVAE